MAIFELFAFGAYLQPAIGLDVLLNLFVFFIFATFYVNHFDLTLLNNSVNITLELIEFPFEDWVIIKDGRYLGLTLGTILELETDAQLLDLLFHQLNDTIWMKRVSDRLTRQL